jgi:ABC-type uncharacterized transport system auxiliary subunit
MSNGKDFNEENYVIKTYQFHRSFLTTKLSLSLRSRIRAYEKTYHTNKRLLKICLFANLINIYKS